MTWSFQWGWRPCLACTTKAWVAIWIKPNQIETPIFWVLLPTLSRRSIWPILTSSIENEVFNRYNCEFWLLGISLILTPSGLSDYHDVWAGANCKTNQRFYWFRPMEKKKVAIKRLSGCSRIRTWICQLSISDSYPLCHLAYHTSTNIQRTRHQPLFTNIYDLIQILPYIILGLCMTV